MNTLYLVSCLLTFSRCFDLRYQLLPLTIIERDELNYHFSVLD